MCVTNTIHIVQCSGSRLVICSNHINRVGLSIISSNIIVRTSHCAIVVCSTANPAIHSQFAIRSTRSDTYSISTSINKNHIGIQIRFYTEIIIPTYLIGHNITSIEESSIVISSSWNIHIQTIMRSCTIRTYVAIVAIHNIVVCSGMRKEIIQTI